MNVVCIGGGKGLSTVIQAWHQLEAEVTAIVATTDNGGCSGRLREAGSPIAWGDLRKALIAATGRDDTMVDAFSHRFNTPDDLNGHCTGNLMLESLFQQTGSVTQTVQIFGKLIGSRATVLPMCEHSADLLAITCDGDSIKGETNIDRLSKMPIQLLLDRATSAPEQCIQAIAEAELICIGPGSLLTSIMPTLLMPDIQRALTKSTVPKLFIHNINPEQGPASTLEQNKITHWINRHAANITVDAELNHHQLIIRGKAYNLPTTLRSVSATSKAEHDIETLTDALAVSKQCLLNKISLRESATKSSKMVV